MFSQFILTAFLTYRRMLQLQDDIGEQWWKVFLFMDIPFKKIEATLKENPGNVNETVNGVGNRDACAQNPIIYPLL